MTQPRFKIVIDEFASVVVTEPTDLRPRVPANDNVQRSVYVPVPLDFCVNCGQLRALVASLCSRCRPPARART